MIVVEFVATATSASPTTSRHLRQLLQVTVGSQAKVTVFVRITYPPNTPTEVTQQATSNVLSDINTKGASYFINQDFVTSFGITAAGGEDITTAVAAGDIKLPGINDGTTPSSPAAAPTPSSGQDGKSDDDDKKKKTLALGLGVGLGVGLGLVLMVAILAFAIKKKKPTSVAPAPAPDGNSANVAQARSGDTPDAQPF